MNRTKPLKRTAFKANCARDPSAETRIEPRTCSQCPREFFPRSSLHSVCSKPCAMKKLKADAAKEKAEFEARKAENKSMPECHAAAQKACNNYIRYRDRHQPCISCGARPPDLTKLHAGRDAGHYRSIGSAPHMRYEENNVHAQCVSCNQWKAGNAVDYRLGLIARIGLAAVEAVESSNAIRKWTKDEVRAIEATYKEKLAQLKKEQP